MSDQYVRDQTGKLRRVVYVQRGTTGGVPPQTGAIQPYQSYQPPVVYAPPPAYGYAQSAARRGCSPLLVMLLMMFVGVLGLIALIPGMIRPQSPVGKISDGLADTLAAGGIGLRTFAAQMITEPEQEPEPAEDASAPAPPPAQDVADADLSVVGGPSLTVDQINAILADYGSPAEGTGNFWVASGHNAGIDPAFAVAFFVMESTAGSNRAWAGWKPDGTTTHNVGNIICAGYPTCHGRFRDYPSWKEGIDDWFRLIKVEYIDGRGADTLGKIIPVYAPSVENDVQAYIATVARLVRQWRAEGAPAAGPVGGRHEVLPGSVITAGFSTQDCGFWGNQPNCQHLGTDYSVQQDGAPVYAPFDGTYVRTGEYAPGDPSCPRCLGQYVIYDLAHDAPDACQLYLGHLKNATFKEAGEAIRAGDKMGEIRIDLAHTHVQLTCNGQLVDFQAYYDTHER